MMILNKQNLKFFIALSFAQTGVLMCAIILSGFYWHRQSQDFQVLSNQIQQLSCHRDKMEEIQSDIKIEIMKESLKSQGIGVSEE